MNKFVIAALVAGVAAAPAALPAQGNKGNAPGQDRVCLVTWGSAADAATGADATALNGRYLPRRAAEQQASRSGGKSRTFDYSNSTQAGNTGSYTITNNEEERAFCEGPEFDPGQRD